MEVLGCLMFCVRIAFSCCMYDRMYSCCKYVSFGYLLIACCCFDAVCLFLAAACFFVFVVLFVFFFKNKGVSFGHCVQSKSRPKMRRGKRERKGERKRANQKKRESTSEPKFESEKVSGSARENSTATKGSGKCRKSAFLFSDWVEHFLKIYLIL